MKIEHSKGPFKVVSREICEDGSQIPARVDAANSYLCFLEGTTQAWKKTPEVCLTDGKLIAICDRAPHECTVPNCPGDLNRRKLELLEEMLAALEDVMIMWKAPKPKKLDDALTWRQNDEKAELAAFKAIAKAKELECSNKS